MRTTLLLDIAADAFPDRIAITDSERALSLEDLRAHARSVAAWLRQGEAKHVAFIGTNGATLPVLLFASAMGGLPFVPINYRLTDDSLNGLIGRIAPAIVIIDDDMAERIGHLPGIDKVPRSTFEAMFLADTANESQTIAEDEGDIAVLLFTSGTTGEPKAAVLRHANLTSYVMSTVEFMGCDADEAALVSVPPYHIAGISAILSAVYGGRRLVYLPSFSAEAWVETCFAQQITHAMVVPTMLGRILDVLAENGAELPHLQAISYGGGRMPEPVIARALQALPQVDFVNAYGLTETSSTVALLTAEDHRLAIASEDPVQRARLGSVGKPLPSIELEIRGPDGSRLAVGQSGEIYVRGSQVSGEYLHKRALTDDGWFATNDGGWLDEDGYLFVEGRLDDVIVRGGENISPGEIEDVLRSHADVADCAVLGLPDSQWGERVAAVIVPHSAACNTEALASLVKARLRSTKTPESWFVRDALPYNETGKLLRRVLKAELAGTP